MEYRMKENLLNIPKTFKNIQNSCIGSFTIKVAQQTDIQPLSSNIVGSTGLRLSTGYILMLSEGDITFRTIIGHAGGEYRSSSNVLKADLASNRFQTNSGNIYAVDELRFTDPDELTLEICATLHHLGLSSRAGTPPIYF